MNWINHPKFLPVRESILKGLSAHKHHFRKVKPVVFLCGGMSSEVRDTVAEYIQQRPAGSLLFYAERVWNILAEQTHLNALELEEKLAELADIVIIIVESPGTFAELGAFSLSKSLRKKLLPILDARHVRKESFIRSGPVRWIDQESHFNPSIWVSHDIILDAVPLLEDRLSRLPKPTAARIGELASSPKHLLFFICDLVAIFGPCPEEHINYYVQRLLKGVPKGEVLTLLALAKAMGLIATKDLNDNVPLYHRPLSNGRLTAYRTTHYFEIATQRAKVLSVMQSIPGAARAIEIS